jgi:hypothetical protein
MAGFGVSSQRRLRRARLTIGGKLASPYQASYKGNLVRDGCPDLLLF